MHADAIVVCRREFIVTGRMPEKLPSEVPSSASPPVNVDASAAVAKAAAADATTAAREAQAALSAAAGLSLAHIL